MKKFVAGTVAFMLLSIILWFFWGWGAAIFIVLAMLTLGLAFRYMPGYRVYFAFLIIGSILAMVVVPTVRHFITQEFPQFRIANDRSILELDHKLSKLTDSSMVYSKTAMRSYLATLDGILKRQLDQQLETLLQKKQNGTFGQSEAVELAQIIHRINVWGMIYEANQEAVDKGKMPTNMLTVAVRVGQYDVPLYGGDGREIVIENGNPDQVSNGKIRAGAVVKIVIPEMVRQFVGQPETNLLQQWVVSNALSRQFQPGEVFAIVYLDDANGLPTANPNRCGWLPLSAFEAVVNPYNTPKRAVQNDPSGGWQASLKNSLAAGNKIRWGSFLAVVALMIFGYWAAGKWLAPKHKTLASVCHGLAIILIALAAWSYIIGPFGQAALAGESSRQKSSAPPAKLISQNSQAQRSQNMPEAKKPAQEPQFGGRIILTSSQELFNGLTLTDVAGSKIYWHRYGWVRHQYNGWVPMLPCGVYSIRGVDRRVTKFNLSNVQFRRQDMPAYCVLASWQGKTTSWPEGFRGAFMTPIVLNPAIFGEESSVGIGILDVPADVESLELKINAPVDRQLEWKSDQGSIVLEVVK